MPALKMRPAIKERVELTAELLSNGEVIAADRLLSRDFWAGFPEASKRGLTAAEADLLRNVLFSACLEHPSRALPRELDYRSIPRGVPVIVASYDAQLGEDDVKVFRGALAGVSGINIDQLEHLSTLPVYPEPVYPEADKNEEQIEHTTRLLVAEQPTSMHGYTVGAAGGVSLKWRVGRTVYNPKNRTLSGVEVVVRPHGPAPVTNALGSEHLVANVTMAINKSNRPGRTVPLGKFVQGTRLYDIIPHACDCVVSAA